MKILSKNDTEVVSGGRWIILDEAIYCETHQTLGEHQGGEEGDEHQWVSEYWSKD